MRNFFGQLGAASQVMVETLRHPTYTLRLLGDPVLTEQCAEVPDLDAVPLGLMMAMKEACDHFRAPGISAPQLGVPIRVALIAGGRVCLINPEIVKMSGQEDGEEGCLSIPGFYTRKTRFTEVTLRYRSETFLDRTMTFSGMDARCALHEIDHMNGILLTQGVSRQRRRAAERLVAKVTEDRLKRNFGNRMKEREPSNKSAITALVAATAAVAGGTNG